jgi:hypothetical protein
MSWRWLAHAAHVAVTKTDAAAGSTALFIGRLARHYSKPFDDCVTDHKYAHRHNKTLQITR